MKKRRSSRISESSDSDVEPPSSTSRTSQPIENSTSSSYSSSSSSDSDEKPVKSPKKEIPKPEPKRLNPLDDFLARNPNLKRVVLDDFITSDDEVSLLEVPRDVDAALFVGKCINLEGRSKIKIRKTKYVVEPAAEAPRPTAFLTNKLRVINPVGVLKLREYNKHRVESEAIDTGQFHSVLPENLKVRHPLFGAAFEEKVVLKDDVQQKLENWNRTMKKKAKKKKRLKEEPPETEFSIEESIFGLLSDHVEQKGVKSKKRRNSERESGPQEDALVFNLLETEERGGNIKRKRKKSKTYDSQGEETTVTEEEMLPPQKKKTKMENQEVVANGIVSPTSKKKKKKFSQEDTEDNVEFEVKKEKKKNRSFGESEGNIANSTMIPGLQLPMFELFDVSGVLKQEDINVDDDDESTLGAETPSKKKKKNKQKEASPEPTPSKTKRKRIKSEMLDESSRKSPEDDAATNTLISGILSQIKLEFDTSPKPKKKKFQVFE